MGKIRKKTIQLPQRFNPGTMQYESELPFRRRGKNYKIKANWKELIITIILVLILLGIFFIALKLGVF